MIKTTTPRAVRLNCIKSIYYAGSGHPGGCLSCIDIMFSIFKNFFNYKKDYFKKKNRNYFVLSKGHSAPALYAVCEYFKFISKKNIFKLRKINSIAQGHTHLTKEHLWMGANTGSLGQGLSFAVGYAVALKKIKSNKKVFVILGDGELQEGQVWEAFMFASHYNLNNLIIFIDYNKLQSDDKVKNIINIEPLSKKLSSFNLIVKKIDGHNISHIAKIIKFIKNYKKKKPIVIIADTIKGKGIKFMENNPLWHGSVKITNRQLLEAEKEILKKYAK